MTAYYNEHDPFAAAWLRELIKDGLIAPGDVDERDIQDVTPADVANYTQCHFFAGIGGWSYALRLAGWPDDRPVWTGSPPCQPFSAAGKGAGFADERHLWPAFFWLIRQCKPGTIFGEQVSSKASLGWWDVVAADLEASGYGVGAFDLCAAGIEAPHKRPRLYFVAHATGHKWQQGQQEKPQKESDIGRRGGFGDMAHTNSQQRNGARPSGPEWNAEFANSGGLGDTSRTGLPSRQQKELPGAQPIQERGAAGQSGGSFWASAEWLICKDGKARPVEPSIFPLAHGVPNRVGTLRGAGNAIVPELAAQFVGAYLDFFACSVR